MQQRIDLRYIFATFLCVFLSAPALAQNHGPITIGLQTPQTGAASEIGLGAQYGAQFAFKEINAHGGINGHEIALVVADDRSAPDGAVSAIQKLSNLGGIKLIWNTSSSSPTIAVVGRMKAGPLPYFVSFASDPRVLEPFSKYVFLGAALPVQNVAIDVANFVTDRLHAHSVATLSCDQANCKTGVPLLQAALKQKGVTIAAAETYNSGDVDFTGQIGKIKAVNPDVVQVWGLTMDGARIVAQLRRAGITAKIVGDQGVADQSVISLAGDSAEGMYAVWIGGSQFITDETGAMGAWRKAFNVAFPNAPEGLPNVYSARAYADAYVIAEALRQAGDNLTPDNIIASLERIHDFIAGKAGDFPYAAPIGLPRGFSATNHQGNFDAAIVVVKDGHFMSMSKQ
jgi:branched-chain amino acid transport system substrate-binding protein